MYQKKNGHVDVLPCSSLGFCGDSLTVLDFCCFTSLTHCLGLMLCLGWRSRVVPVEGDHLVSPALCRQAGMLPADVDLSQEEKDTLAGIWLLIAADERGRFVGVPNRAFPLLSALEGASLRKGGDKRSFFTSDRAAKVGSFISTQAPCTEVLLASLLRRWAVVCRCGCIQLIRTCQFTLNLSAYICNLKDNAC